MSTRELGTIGVPKKSLDREIFYTVWVYWSGNGGMQGFGGTVLGKTTQCPVEGQRMQDVFIAELCSTFGVSTPDELEGRSAYALRYFGSHNESIVGLEDAKSGRRFLLRRFAQRHWPDAEHRHPLLRERAAIEREIKQAEKAIHAGYIRLTVLESQFAGWAKEEFGHG